MHNSNTASAPTRDYRSVREAVEARSHAPARTVDPARPAQKVTAQQVSEEQITEEQIADQQVTEEQVSEEQIADQQVSEEQITEKQVAEAGVTAAFPAADLVELPFNRARIAPQGPCLSWSDDSFDNSEFASAVAATADFMSTHFRIGYGSVVAVLNHTAPEIITTMFAAWSLGAALTPIDPALNDAEVSFQLDDSGAVLLVGDTRAEAVADFYGLGFLSVDDDCFRGDGEPLRDLDVRGEDASLVVYTSGTTGTPKGCLLNHSNVSAMVWSILSGIDFGEDPRSLLMVPLVHCNGFLAGALVPLMVGGSVHVLPTFDPRTFWSVVETERPTFFSAVPTMCSVLEATTDRDVDTSSLRFVICGTAPMAVDVITGFEAKFDVPVLEGYGLSECSAVTVNRNDSTRRLGTVGRALPGITVAIRDPDGWFLPAGGVGEVVVSGRTLMRGYLGRPEATVKALKESWLHTGDVGFLDEDGFLTLQPTI